MRELAASVYEHAFRCMLSSDRQVRCRSFRDPSGVGVGAIDRQGNPAKAWAQGSRVAFQFWWGIGGTAGTTWNWQREFLNLEAAQRGSAVDASASRRIGGQGVGGDCELR